MMIKRTKNQRTHFLWVFLVMVLCLALTLGRCTGESSEEDEESSELFDEDDDYYCFFLFIFFSLVGITLIFFIDLLYISFHHSSFQFVASFWVFTPRPKPSSLLLIWTQSFVPCCFLPRPFPYFHPIWPISFFAYSLSNFLFETPEDCKSLYLYLSAICSQQ